MEQTSYDLVISDMARGEDTTAGLGLLESFRKENRAFYLEPWGWRD